MNALANEALPLFLDKLVPAYMAVIISVTLVLFFGEIIPSAIFTGPNQLAISSKLAPLVKIVLLILKPIAWPIAKALDYFLHHDESDTLEKYDRSELSALVRLQFEHRMSAKLKKKHDLTQSLVLTKVGGAATVGVDGIDNNSNNNNVGQSYMKGNMATSRSSSVASTSASASTRFVKVVDEVMMVEGALKMHSKQVIDVMQPWTNVYSIPKDMILNEANIVEIYRSGHSRIPVYDNSCKNSLFDDDMTRNVCGLFMARQLAIVNSHDDRPLSTLPLAQPFIVEPSMNMVDLLNLLQEGKGKVAIVCFKPDEARVALSNGKAIPQSAEVVGLVTLEDCIEELIQEEIYDEYDKDEIRELNRMKWVVGRWKAFVKKRKKEKIQVDVSQTIDETTQLLETL
jgi:metal transporter CNNM